MMRSASPPQPRRDAHEYDLHEVRIGGASRVRSLLRRNPAGALGLAIVIFVGLVALVGPSFTANPARLSAELLENPSRAHWFGTDQLGRDYLARVVAGARLSLSLAVTAVVLGVAVALVAGTMSAYLGGLFDLLGQRLIDMLLAFPGLTLLMLFGQVLGRGWLGVAAGLGVIYAVTMTRVVRSYALGILAQPYVESARVIGSGPGRVLLRYVVPNLAAPLLVFASALFGSAILAEGALAFLGLGVPPPQPSWGRMLAEARSQWSHPYLSIFPGVAMTLSVLGFSLLGDSLRDELDPRLRHR